MAGPPVRERYNAKARGSVAGGSGGHKKRKRPKSKPDAEGSDGDVQMEQQPTAVPEGAGMSSKKRKRMESYIAKKLKNESRAETIKLLASLAPSTSASAGLLSSSSLGQNPLNPTSAKERKDLREDRLVRRGIEVLKKRIGSGGEDGDSEDEVVVPTAKGKERETIVDIDQAEDTEMGDDVGMEQTHAGKGKNRKRKSNAAKKASWNPNLLQTQPDSSSDFDSSDSGDDTPSEAEEETIPIVPPKPFTAVSPPPHQAGPSSEAGPSSTKTTDSAPSAAGSALKRPLIPGGALKKGADGAVIAPRVVVRRKKQLEADSSGDEDEEDSDDEDSNGPVEESDEEDMNEEEEEEMGSDEDSDGDSSEDEEDGDDESEHLPKAPNKERSLGFKTWALKQMGQSEQPSAPDLLDTSTSAPSKPKRTAVPGPMVGPLGEDFAIPTTSLLDHSAAGNAESSKRARPTIARRPSVSESRLDLPILAEEQNIIEAIRMNAVVVICGETGSGKTTQVPQMLYEAGFGYAGSSKLFRSTEWGRADTQDDPGMIAVTQPRRVAAVSLAARVKSELNLPTGSGVVAYQIRYSSTTSPDTAIKFMTDGVLLRELSADFLLSRYSVVVVDEAHERGVNTDVLIGVLSRVAKLREKKWRETKDRPSTSTALPVRPLRIIIMSATLRLTDFTANKTLFPVTPPIIHISARQHPVTIHFSRKTTADYVDEAYRKVCKIHARLPVGGILVFMTGQAEIMGLCRKLEQKYGKERSTGSGGRGGGGSRGRGRGGGKAGGRHQPEYMPPASIEVPPEDREAEDVEFGQDNDLAADVDDGDGDGVDDPEALDTEDEGDDELGLNELSGTPMHILPLYSLLSNDQQLKVFQQPPTNHRLVIISTNVAETSLTIPGIRYVVDSGRAKERTYDTHSGVQSFQVQWISKASANQRAGRAGRTGPGHCYRLYSSALYEDQLPAFGTPEILRMPIEGVVLQMKSMGIDQVVNFPFPTPPDRLSLRKAEILLQNLGALSSPTSTTLVAGTQVEGAVGGQITALGKQMSEYPVSPRFAKMLAIGNQHGAMPYIIAIVAGMSVGDPFVHESAIEADDEDAEGLAYLTEEDARRREERKEARKRYFKAQSAFLALGDAASDAFKLLAAIGAYEYEPTSTFCQSNFLRLKAMQEIQQLRGQIGGISGQKKGTGEKLKPPTETQLKVIRQILTSAFIDQIAVRADLAEKKPQTYLSCRNVAYRLSTTSTDIAYIHPSSALFHRPPPDFIVYSELHRTAKHWMRGVTKINAGWIWSLGRNLCAVTRPTEIGEKASPAGVKVDERLRGVEREVGVVPNLRALGVDLPAVKIKQRREGSRWVYIE